MLDKIIFDMSAEMKRAQAKFPTWPQNIVEAAAVVSEEMGEVVKDANTYRWRQGKATPQDIYTEAIQTGAMLLRFLTETPVMAALTQGHMFVDMCPQSPDFLPCMSVDTLTPALPDLPPYATVKNIFDVASKLQNYGNSASTVFAFLDTIAFHMPVKMTEIIEGTGLSDRTIRDLLTKAGRDMVHAGYTPLVIREKHGREVFYSLAPDWEVRLEKAITHQLDLKPSTPANLQETISELEKVLTERAKLSPPQFYVGEDALVKYLTTA